MPTGEKIKKIRLKNGITQKKLADLLNTSQQNIAQYESGKRKPKIETLHKIAHALNVPVTELVESDVLQLTNDIIDLFSDPNIISEDLTPASPQEHYLISKFRELNEKGQNKVVDYAEDLSKAKEYTKNEVQ